MVDDASEDPASPLKDVSLRENGIDKNNVKKENLLAHSPRSSSSSNASTPISKKIDCEKSSTPVSKSVTPTPSSQSSNSLRAIPKPMALSQYQQFMPGILKN